jgi:hypothetical protein
MKCARAHRCQRRRAHEHEGGYEQREPECPLGPVDHRSALRSPCRAQLGGPEGERTGPGSLAPAAPCAAAVVPDRAVINEKNTSATARGPPCAIHRCRHAKEGAEGRHLAR